MLVSPEIEVFDEAGFSLLKLTWWLINVYWGMFSYLLFLSELLSVLTWFPCLIERDPLLLRMPWLVVILGAFGFFCDEFIWVLSPVTLYALHAGAINALSLRDNLFFLRNFPPSRFLSSRITKFGFSIILYEVWFVFVPSWYRTGFACRATRSFLNVICSMATFLGVDGWLVGYTFFTSCAVLCP